MQTNPAKKPLDGRQDAKALQELKLRAIAVRRFLLNLGFEKGIRLHYGAMLSIIEILVLLYDRWLRHDPKNPEWEGRDRFVLSKGHAAPALYAALAFAGFFGLGEFASFRTLGSRLQGHPDRNKTPGVDCSTGSLGQGFPVACGMALSSKIDQGNCKVYACLSDGECNEGSIWEAALIASNLGLDALIAIVDWNKKSSYGSMKNRNDVEPLIEKWRAFNWATYECDGHDYLSLSAALSRAESTKGKPSVLLCHTVKGKGIPWAEGTDTRSNFQLEKKYYEEALAALHGSEKEILHESA
jgi:transketolase